MTINSELFLNKLDIFCMDIKGCLATDSTLDPSNCGIKWLWSTDRVMHLI